MFKKILLVSMLVFSIGGGNSYVMGAGSNSPAPTPPVVPVVPTPTPNPIPSPSVEPTIVIIDNKLVKATDVLAPIVKITGAESPIDLGDLVFLECKVDNSLPQFIKTSTYKWTIEGKNARGTSTNQVFFGAGIKNTTVKAHVDVALTYQVDQELVIKTVSGDVDVQIGSPTPNPPGPDPSPVPPAPPTPNLTDNQKAIYDIAMNTFGKNLGTDDFKKAATILSADFSDAAKKITDGKYDSFSAFSEDLKNTNQAAVKLLNLDVSKFDNFRTELNNFLFQYYTKHGLKTNPMSPNGDETLKVLSDWVPVINDIAAGLKAAGGN